MHARESERASVRVERDQEGERKRAEKEAEETQRERELCAVADRAGASRSSPGKGRLLALLAEEQTTRRQQHTEWYKMDLTHEYERNPGYKCFSLLRQL
ncbi:Hypothetical predicted protein [Xyrichtys novacula]|uniref:Uncharacterized protein n=1 Tax=Xyrichtys novacula TaxID=13765 RepID=A0AAV1FY12_XYRNO|nr:Hypothetical predicted protein [Xyrichtys novacula]